MKLSFFPLAILEDIYVKDSMSSGIVEERKIVSSVVCPRQCENNFLAFCIKPNKACPQQHTNTNIKKIQD